MPVNDLSSPGLAAGHRRQALRQSFAVLVLGLGLSLWVAQTLQGSQRTQAWSHFESLIHDGYERVEKRFLMPQFGLLALRAAVLANPRFKRQDFHSYVLERQLLEEFPGVPGFGFVELVPPGEVGAFLHRERADQAPDFQIRRPGPEGSTLYVLKHVEPLAPNFATWGVDLGSDAAQREAVEQAIMSGQMTLSRRTQWKQDQVLRDGLLLVLPLFARDPGPEPDLASRSKALLGLLYAPVLIDELLQGFDAGDKLRMRLFDAKDPSSAHLLFEAPQPDAAAAEDQASGRTPVFTSAKALKVGGRELCLQLSSRQPLELGFRSRLPLYAGVGGALLFALLALLIWQQSLKRWQAMHLARSMTADLRRLAQVAELTENAISLRDLQERIQWVNQGFTQLCGYSAEEAQGQHLGELLERTGSSPETLGTMHSAMAQGRSCRMETRIRAKDGRLSWVESELQPVHDEEGQLVSYMEISRDITTQKLARENLQLALQETDVLNRTIRQYAMVVKTDRQGVIIEVNDAFCRICGYRRDELLGQPHRAFNAKVHRAPFWAELWRTVLEGESWHGQICNRAKNGSYYWLDSLIAPFRDARGDIDKFISISFDISASKLAERSLARERRTLSNILEGTHAGTWAWDMTSGNIEINPQFALMLGYTPQELAPFSFLRWRTLTQQDDLAGIDQALQAHTQGASEFMQATARLHHKDGHAIWVMLRGKINARDSNGKPRWMSGTQIDITASRAAEQTLRDTHERFTLAKDSAGIGMWEFDASTNLMQWDARMFALHGMAALREPLGLARWREVLRPDDGERVAQAFAAALRGEQALDVEFDARWQSGEWRHLRMCAQVMRDANDQALGMVGVALDMTPLRRAQAVVQAVMTQTMNDTAA